MQRLNSASDGPAQLIAAIELRAQLTSIEKGIAASERTRGMLSVADSGLSEASNLLDRIQGNLVAAAGNTASPQERAAMQSEIDAALEALDRLGNITFNGRRVFSGESVEFLVGAEPRHTATVNLGEVNSADLGNESGTLSELGSGGSASLESGNGELAEEILEAARQEILAARVEVGTFEKYTVESNIAVLESMAVNVSSAFSQIADTEVASEMSILARAQILSQTSVQAIKFTNFTSDSAAGLLESLIKRLLM